MPQETASCSLSCKLPERHLQTLVALLTSDSLARPSLRRNGELLFIEFQASQGGSSEPPTPTVEAPLAVAAPVPETKPLADLSKVEEDDGAFRAGIDATGQSRRC